MVTNKMRKRNQHTSKVRSPKFVRKVINGTNDPEGNGSHLANFEVEAGGAGASVGNLLNAVRIGCKNRIFSLRS